MGDIEVKIIEATNLPSAVPNGKSDPFVSVQVLEDPGQVFKTKVRHKVTHSLSFYDLSLSFSLFLLDSESTL